MKLEPLFEVKNNELFTVSGAKVELNLVPVTDIKAPQNFDKNNIYNTIISRKTVETEPECYNEEYLAQLRDFLKKLEEDGIFAVLTVVPGDDESGISVKQNGASDVEVESYIACIKHTARRVKDCVSVAGIYIDSDFAAVDAVNKVMLLEDELLKKHAQYVFAASAALRGALGGLSDEYMQKIVFEA